MLLVIKFSINNLNELTIVFTYVTYVDNEILNLYM